MNYDIHLSEHGCQRKSRLIALSVVAEAAIGVSACGDTSGSGRASSPFPDQCRLGDNHNPRRSS